ncbi:MAG TPA: carboxypeptidase regulatory-like domain-containing protein [Candidatus Acidoferrum sp.]|nr:carboxypeptidase regulatory-like domain-containing protein [Candidatus Acidoferrum sp.]
MENRSRFLTSALLLVLVALFSSNVLRADVTGSILGVVHDRSQGMVAGARIIATNVQTNLSQETVSASDGSFRILALPAGTYKLTVSAAGFKQYNTTDIDLKVNDQLRFEVTLDVGSVSEKVEITANAVQVQTESTQLGDVIESKKILALPLNNRSYIDLLGLQAGVAPSTAGTIGLPNGPGSTPDRAVSGNLSAGNISVNGQRETANAFLVNGGDVSEGRNLGAGLIPNLESIEEFRLITNSFDAEYGKFSGAVVNAITKSGTNGIHGDVFEFWRNDKLDASNFFFAGKKSELRRNQFGYAVGGPFWKNKLFWFTDYQGTREVDGAEANTTLPNLAQRGGQFDPTLLTGSIDGAFWAQTLTTRLGYTVCSAVVTVACPSGIAEKYSFAGCNSTNPVTGCVFPGGLIPKVGMTGNTVWSAPAIGILPFIPMGDPITGAYTNNSQKNTITDNKAAQRVDFVNQKTGNWSFYYHFDDSTFLNALPFASVPGFPSSTPARAQQFVMSNTKNFGPTAVNEARVSFFRAAVHKDNPTGSFAKLSDLGFITAPGSLGILPDGTPGYPQFVPQITFSNFNLGVPELNTFQPDNTYMASDGFSKVLGRHTLKFGGEFRYLQVNERNIADVNGTFGFNGSVTGVDFADYLLGAPQAGGGYIQAALQLLDSRTRYGGAYIQDAWKAKPNLTLNLGLRWEASMPWYDTQGKIETWVPGEQSVIFPNSPKGWVFPGDPGVPKTLAPTRYNNFGPRVGLAYSPDFSDGVLGKIFGGPGKTSIRASYGIYYTSIEDLNLFFEVADAPYGLFWVAPTGVLFEEPFRTRTDGSSQTQRFPFTLPTPGNPANKTLDFSVYEPISFSPGYLTHDKLPYAEHFNLSIQRELSKSTVLTLAYVGTAGHNLITSSEANPGSAALCKQLNAQGFVDLSTGGPCGPNTEQDTFAPAAATSCQPFNAACVYGTRNTLLNPNFCPTAGTLCFGSGNTFTRTDANSIFHAGELSVERKATDVTFLAAYTFSRAIDNSSSFGDLINFSNPRLSRGLSSADVTHNFVGSYIWAIPFDRAFGRWPKRLTQGWQMQGITRFSTGFPIQLGENADDTSLAGSSSTDMPNRVGNVVTVNPRKVYPGCHADPNNPTVSTSGCYFLPGAFAKTSCTFSAAGLPSPDCGTFGTANRRFFHGPGFNNTDFGLLKRTAIREKMAFEIRGEFFNIFNHAQFFNPGGNIDSSANFGIVKVARPPRIGQLSAKFYW